MRQESTANNRTKNHKDGQKAGLSIAYRILMFGLILLPTGLFAHLAAHLIGSAPGLQGNGDTQFAFLHPLLPYRDYVTTLAEMALMYGLAIVVGSVLFFIIKTEVVKSRVMITGIPVPVVIKAVSQYEAKGLRGGSWHYETAFEIEVRPPGETPFHASVKDRSEDVYNTEYLTGSTIAALYDRHTKIIRIPGPDFNEAEHKRRARTPGRSIPALFIVLAITFLKHNLWLLIAALAIASAVATGLHTLVDDAVKIAVFVAIIAMGGLAGVVSGLTTREIAEPDDLEDEEEKKRYTPQPFKNMR